MTFLNLGLALAGLACIAIPVIIHLLFRRRRKPIEWAAMRFLLEAYRKQRRRLTLEQIILLACRCLVVACLAIALGRPVLQALGALGGGAARTVYLLIDNSAASSLRDESTGETALDRHKRTATETLRALGDTDRAALVFLGAPADPVVVPPSPDIAAVIDTVESIEPTDAAADFAGALSAVAGAAEDAPRPDSGERVVVIVSDLLQGALDPARPAPGLGEALAGATLVATRPRESAPGNTQIIAVEPLRSFFFSETTGGDADALSSASVRVSLRRTGPAVAQQDATNVRLRVETGRAPIGQAPEIGRGVIRWAPGQETATASVIIDPAAIASAARSSGAAIVAEIDRDAIESDNTYRLPIEVRDRMRVGVLARQRFTDAIRADRLTPGEWLALAVNPTDDSVIDVRTIDPAAIDAAVLDGLDAVLAPRPDLIDAQGWRRLRAFVDAGGLLALFPPADTTVHLWTDAAARELDFPWTLARETREHDRPRTLAAEQPRSGLLTLLLGEFEQLAARVNFYKTLPITEAGAGAAILRFDGGEPFIVAARPDPAGAARADQPDLQTGPDTQTPPSDSRGRGLIVCFASALDIDWTDLPAKPLMVPLINEIVREGVAQARASGATIAGHPPIAPPRAVEIIDTESPDARPITINEAGTPAQPLRRAALYRALDQRGSARGLVAVNTDPDAARTNTIAPTAAAAWFADAGFAPGAISLIDTAESPASLARALADEREAAASSLPWLIAALVFAIIETLLARLFSHAQTEPRAPGAGAPNIRSREAGA